MEGKDKNTCNQIFFFDEGRVEKKIDNTLTKKQAIDIVDNTIQTVLDNEGPCVITKDLELLREWIKNK